MMAAIWALELFQAGADFLEDNHVHLPKGNMLALLLVP